MAENTGAVRFPKEEGRKLDVGMILIEVYFILLMLWGRSVAAHLEVYKKIVVLNSCMVNEIGNLTRNHWEGMFLKWDNAGI